METENLTPYSIYQTRQNHPSLTTSLDWQSLRETHQQELLPIVGPHLQRASRGDKHPVYDFLFTYYSFRPSQLLRWTPGFGVVLPGASEQDFPETLGFRHREGSRTLDPAAFPKKRVPFLRWARHMNEVLLERVPRFSCFGLHEWAMLYRVPIPRHQSLPLRVSPTVIEAVVDKQTLQCSHFDAFRFFSAEAVPKNDCQLSRDASLTHEQPGCLHATMDLYKCCYKLYPWVSSTTLRQAFFLALDARVIDMEASPYDVTSLGFGAIPVETEAGKAVYVEKQRGLHHRAHLLRQRIVSELVQLSDWVAG